MKMLKVVFHYIGCEREVLHYNYMAYGAICRQEN